MAIYVWRGENPDRVYVVNRHGVRVECRETYSAPEPRRAIRRCGVINADYGSWIQMEHGR